MSFHQLSAFWNSEIHVLRVLFYVVWCSLLLQNNNMFHIAIPKCMFFFITTLLYPCPSWSCGAQRYLDSYLYWFTCIVLCSDVDRCSSSTCQLITFRRTTVTQRRRAGTNTPLVLSVDLTGYRAPKRYAFRPW